MPTKRNSRTNTVSKDVDFVLKHRVVGAGFLLLFGALILPWMLGSPSQINKQTSAQKQSEPIELLKSWPQRKADVRSDEFTNQVRGKAITGDNYRESLSHQKIPK